HYSIILQVSILILLDVADQDFKDFHITLFHGVMQKVMDQLLSFHAALIPKGLRFTDTSHTLLTVRVRYRIASFAFSWHFTIGTKLFSLLLHYHLALAFKSLQLKVQILCLLHYCSHQRVSFSFILLALLFFGFSLRFLFLGQQLLQLIRSHVVY